MLWWLISALLAVAQEPVPGVPPGSSLEDAAWEAMQDDRFVTARRLAEALLVEEPRSLRGHYVLGYALKEGEGDLPRAKEHFLEVVAIYEANFDQEPDSPWQMHLDACKQLSYTAAAMDDREEQLAWIELHDDLYSPELVGQRVWPLMKLGRFDEAREWAAKALETDRAWQHSIAQNGLCAMEGELGHREAYYRACMDSLDAEIARGWDVSVNAHNAALAVRADLRFDELEATARKGTSGSGAEVSNPWMQLAGIHLSMGRGVDAVTDVRNMQKWRLRQPPDMRDQVRAEVEGVFATVLLAAGFPSKGMAVIDRALRYPDRQGYSSGSSDDAVVFGTLLRISMRASLREREAEARAASSWPVRWLGALADWLPDPADLADRATVQAICADRERLDGLFRVFLFDGVDLPVWMLGDTIDVLGTGVAAAALDAFRRADPEPRFVPWQAAFAAEIAWRQGDMEAAAEQAAVAREGLPAAAVLLRARVAAIFADAAWRRGGRPLALAAYEQVMTTDPGVMRRLGLRLPATVRGHGPVTDALRRSPRIGASGAFEVSVSEGEDVVRACLLTPDGSRLGCPEVTREQGEAEDVFARRASDTLQRRLFAMPMGLSQIDLDSLDGTTTVAREAAVEALDQLLDGL